MATLASVNIRDVIANLPLAGIPGREFFALDTRVTLRDNGTSWDDDSSIPAIGVNAQTGTSYTVVSDDRAFLLTLSNASPVAVSLPQATGLFDVGFWLEARNLGAGTVTITAATSLIDGAASLDLAQGESVRIISDGTDYQITALIRATFPESINAQTGTSYTVLASDKTKLVTLSNGSAVAITLPQATGSFGAGWFADVKNLGAGAVTITPTTSTIGGASTLVLATGDSARVISDGTNYQVTNLVRFALVPTSRTISTTAPLTGGGDLSANRTLAISVFGASGSSHSTGAVPDPGSSAGSTKFLREDATFAIPAGTSSGTVTSVALTVPAEFSVAGSPVTTSGTLAVTKATQSANIVYAGPSSGGAAAPTFRALVHDDLPAQPYRIPVSFIGNPVDGATDACFIHVFDDAATAPGNFSGSNGKLGKNGVNPTATATWNIYNGSTLIGTAVCSTSGVFTFTTVSGTSKSFAVGDCMTVLGPSPQDATLKDPAFTLAFTR